MNREEFRNAADRNLIEIKDVAKVLGVSVSSVHSLISRGSDGFPTPIFEKRGTSRSAIRLWWKPDVETWAQGRPGRGRPATTRTQTSNR